MGQEASVPLPDGHYPVSGAAAAHEDHSTIGNKGGGARASAKALGNMIRRANDGGGGVEFNDREAARAAAAGGHFVMASSGNSVDFATHSANDHDTQSAYPSHQQQYPASQMTPEQQQAYLVQKQYEQEQRMKQQAYMQQQQAAAYSNGGIPAPPPPPPMLHHQSRSPPHDAAVTIMMTESSSSSSSAMAKSGGRSGKLPGTRLINSMKNLAISAKGAVAHGDVHADASSGRSPAADSVSDWQRQWEDDDESDEDDEENLKMPAKGVHTPQRPGVNDGTGYATTQTASTIVGDPRMAVAAAGLTSPELESATLSTRSPTKDGVIRMTPSRQYDRQLSDGVEWDTAKQVMPRKEKPSIEMFLPMLRVLGKGSFGKVVLVQKNCGGDVGQLFAMKILKKEYLKKRRQVERTQTENKVLQAVNHPFIMKMHYAFQSEDKLFFVLDYCAGGELFFHLSRFRRFPERVARFYTSELLLAIGHLHKRGIIYRDLKPENVLIDADGHVKLGDFGLAKTGIHHPCEGAMSMCGTPEYMAPEVLLQSGHGFCVDYWGIGMLVYEMMTGLPPWYTTDRAKLFRRLKSAPLEIPSFFSDQCADCVGAFLERSPRRRLGYRGLKNAMEHPFFRPINFRALYARRMDPPIRPCDGWNEQDALAAINSPVGGESEARDALDRATANFDQTFTNMPVDQEDDSADDYDDGSSYEAHDDNYVGFTYDDEDFQKYPVSAPSRQRTQHVYHQTKE